eukprot:1803940-Rhodomonas_salina.2
MHHTILGSRHFAHSKPLLLCTLYTFKGTIHPGQHSPRLCYIISGTVLVGSGTDIRARLGLSVNIATALHRVAKTANQAHLPQIRRTPVLVHSHPDLLSSRPEILDPPDPPDSCWWWSLSLSLTPVSSQTQRQRGREGERQAERQAGRQSDRQTETDRDRQRQKL